MNARPGFKLSEVTTVVDRFFEVLGYERKRPHLTRIVIMRAPEMATFATARATTRPMALASRRSRL